MRAPTKSWARTHKENESNVLLHMLPGNVIQAAVDLPTAVYYVMHLKAAQTYDMGSGMPLCILQNRAAYTAAEKSVFGSV